MGREILFYLIIYRKCIRKWWLLKRNRKLFPEVAVNEEFLPWKSKLFLIVRKKSKSFENLPEKIEIFQKISWKYRNLSWNCLKKSKFIGNLPRKIDILLTRIHDPPDFKPDWRRWALQPISYVPQTTHTVKLLYIAPQGTGVNGSIYPRFEINHIHLFALIVPGPFTVVW